MMVVQVAEQANTCDAAEIKADFPALAQVVDSRSYSRISGHTSEESEMGRAGEARRTISATRCSCAGLA